MYYTNPGASVLEVARLVEEIGYSIPKRISDKLESLDQISCVYDSHPATPRVKITASNAEQVVYEYAQQLALVEAGGGLSPVTKAKKNLRESIAREVINDFKDEQGKIFALLNETVEGASEKFVKAVAVLPIPLDPNLVIQAGPDVLEALGEAREAAGLIRAAKETLRRFRDLLGLGNPIRELEVFAPKNLAEFNVVKAGPDTSTVDYRDSTDFEKEIGYDLLTAARAGIEIRLNSYEDALEIEQSIQDEQDEQDRKRSAAGGGAIWRPHSRS